MGASGLSGANHPVKMPRNVTQGMLGVLYPEIMESCFIVYPGGGGIGPGGILANLSPPKPPVDFTRGPDSETARTAADALLARDMLCATLTQTCRLRW